MRGQEAIAASGLRMKDNRAAARAHYAKHRAAILSAGPNAWGVDPYQWEFEARIELSPIERLFWFDIRAQGVVLYPQYPLGPYFLDFANPAARLAIECDGAAYHTDPQHDAERQRAIEAIGWAVYRISGSDCYRDDELTVDLEGRSTYSVSPGRRLIRTICADRDIRVMRRSDAAFWNALEAAQA